MARKKGTRQETSTGDDGGTDGDESYELWTKKAGRKTGFDFRTRNAIFGDGKEIPVEFLEEEARRDKTVYGKVIPMDSVDFETVQESFYKRLKSFEKNKETELQRSQRSSRANAGSNSARERKMAGHPERRSPAFEASSDVKQFAQPQRASEAGSPRQSCSLLPLQTPAAEDIRPRNGDSSASLPDAASINTESDYASTSCTRQTLQRNQDTASEARSGPQHAEKPQWQVGQVALYEQRMGNGAQRFVTVQVTTSQRVAEGGMFLSTDERGCIAVTDGAKTFFAAAEELMEVEVSSSLVARLQSGVGASTSQTTQNFSQTTVLDRWEWLTPLGLAQAQSTAVPVSRRVVPHLVGKGGKTIRMIEDAIGVIIGIMDGQDGQASISLVGPQDRIAAARPIITAVAGGGAWSLLHRIKDRGPLFV